MNGAEAGVLSAAPNSLGDFGGEEVHQLSIEEMPTHSHNATMIGGAWGSAGIETSYCCGELPYSNQSTSSVGGDQPHNNMQPYGVVNFIIKMQ